MWDQNRKMPRRAFLRGSLAAAAGGAAISCAKRGGNSAWRFFSAEEAETVDALCAQIIPADRDAGAHEAGVVNYIDIQLTKHFKRYQATYRQGIAAVDAASRKQFGKRFVELPADQQVQVMADAEENSKTFFDLLVAHTRQGFYGDPRHGGNRNRVSWKMLDLPFPQVRGRMHYGDQPEVGISHGPPAR
jgi:gluconate 2-dehydrogenase gamma chain